MERKTIDNFDPLFSIKGMCRCVPNHSLSPLYHNAFVHLSWRWIYNSFARSSMFNTNDIVKQQTTKFGRQVNVWNLTLTVEKLSFFMIESSISFWLSVWKRDSWPNVMESPSLKSIFLYIVVSTTAVQEPWQNNTTPQLERSSNSLLFSRTWANSRTWISGTSIGKTSQLLKICIFSSCDRHRWKRIRRRAEIHVRTTKQTLLLPSKVSNGRNGTARRRKILD